MADVLTRAERTAIASYRGPVTRCAPGTFQGDAPASFAQQIKGWWMGKTKRLIEAEAEALPIEPAISPDEAIRISAGADV